MQCFFPYIVALLVLNPNLLKTLQLDFNLLNADLTLFCLELDMYSVQFFCWVLLVWQHKIRSTLNDLLNLHHLLAWLSSKVSFQTVSVIFSSIMVKILLIHPPSTIMGLICFLTWYNFVNMSRLVLNQQMTLNPMLWFDMILQVRVSRLLINHK